MRRPGITMVELTLVIGLVVMMTLVSTGWYSRFLTQNAVSDTTDQVVETIRKAQIYAISGKRNRSWGVEYVNDAIKLFAQGTTDFDEYYSVNPEVTVTGLTQIVFVGAAGTPSASAVITISGNNTIKTVTVNGAGLITR